MMQVIFDEDYRDEHGIEHTLVCACETLGQDNVTVSVSMMSEQEIRQANLEERDVDSVTDVLSFPTLENVRGKTICAKDFPYDVDPETGLVDVGCIAICEARARAQAAEYGHGIKREMNFLALHGFLHLLGYDHMTEDDESQMTGIAVDILDKLSIGRKDCS